MFWSRSTLAGFARRPAPRPRGGTPARRALLLAGLPALALVLVLGLPGRPAGAEEAGRWAATWGAAPAGPPSAAGLQTFRDQTLRLVVRTSIGGNRVRVRLSNEFGNKPLAIGAVRIGVRSGGADVAPGSDRALSFGGRGALTIPAGATALSDPVELNVPALADLAVSLYLPGTAEASTLHGGALQTNYVSTPGDFSAAATFPVQRTITSWPYLTEVDIEGDRPVIVAIGDSITAGARATFDANNRWTDWLARRLQAERDPRLLMHGRIGVVNRGIGGNRLLGAQPANAVAGGALPERIERDVLGTSGVRYLILSGINDIGNRPGARTIPSEELIAGYRQLIARAHARGIAVFGATLTPFEGALEYGLEKEAVRQAVNSWIRASDEFDGVIDFDLALRDPARPARMLPAYDSGDHLHPNDLGYQAMGNAVPLVLFRTPETAARQLARTAGR